MPFEPPGNPDQPPDPWGGASLPVANSGEWSLDGDEEPETDGERYERGPVLGEGGMGTVYLAQDLRLRRQVALKEARGHAQGAAASRLRREARIIAALDHPNIVPVYELGKDPEGRPWYAMRMVRGRTLDRALAEASDLSARLRLLRPFLGACEAVAHAHERGIVHRDLKPENLLLGSRGEIQVMDWGLARPVEGGGNGWDAVLSGVDATQVGTVLGTPAYMSPEQASGDVVGSTSDVWSLGVCLYELLVGHQAFEGDSAQQVLAQVLTRPVPDPAKDEPGVPPDLAAVVARATARRPEERYPDAGALSADLEAWLDGRRVSAHRYTAADELGRALARSRRTVIAVGLVGLAAVLVVAGLWQNTLAEKDRALAAQVALEEARDRSDAHLAQALVAQARGAAALGARGEAETLAAHSLLLRESPEARGVLLDSAPRPVLRETLALPTGCLELAFDTMGQSLACRGEGSLRLYRARDMALQWEAAVELGEVGFTGPGHPFGRGTRDLRVRVFDRDTGGALVGASELYSEGDGPGLSYHQSRLALRGSTFWVGVDLADGSEVRLASGGPLEGQAVLSSGELLEVRGRRLTIRSWEGEIRVDLTLDGGSSDSPFFGTALAVSADGKRFVQGMLDGWVEVRELETGTRVSATRLLPGAVVDVQLSADGSRVAAVDERGGAWFWSAADPSDRMRLPLQAEQLRFAGEHELLVLGSALRRWELPSVRATSRLLAPTGVSALDWQGAVLAAALGDGTIRTWQEPGPTATDLHWFSGVVAKDVAISPDGLRVGATALGNGVRIDAIGGSEPSAVDALWQGCRRLIWLDPELLICNPQGAGPSVVRTTGEAWPGLKRVGMVLLDAEPDGKRHRAVVLATTGEISVVEAGETPTLRALFTDREVRAVAITNDGEQVVTALSDRVQLREAATGAVIWEQPTATRLRDVALSRDDQLVAGGELGGLTRVWRTSDGALLAVVAGHEERVQSVVFSPDGRRLATGGWDDVVRLWDLGALHRPPALLRSEVEAAWGITLEEALGE